MCSAQKCYGGGVVPHHSICAALQQTQYADSLDGWELAAGQNVQVISFSLMSYYDIYGMLQQGTELNIQRCPA